MSETTPFHWLRETQCASCPFHEKGKGFQLRNSLNPGRWRQILRDLDRQCHFKCHESLDEDHPENEVVCRGSYEYQAAQGIKSNLAQVMERLELMKAIGAKP
jgi:hypothetical protein